MIVKDSTGRVIRPGDWVVYEGVRHRVLSIWNGGDGTDVSLTWPLSGRIVRARGSLLTVVIDRGEGLHVVED